MSYASKHLIPGETLIYQTKLHWVILFWHIVFAIVFLVAPAIALLYYQRQRTDVEYAAAILVVIAVIIICVGMIKRNATEMAVTNKRVLIKQGLTSRRTLELLLQKVESIAVEESLMGRILGYGTVVIRGTGGTPEPFRKMAHPLEFRRHVEEQIGALGASQAPA
jgi:uncharacterized membrane protein YdbT with pleckstrin-like domain